MMSMGYLMLGYIQINRISDNDCYLLSIMYNCNCHRFLVYLELAFLLKYQLFFAKTSNEASYIPAKRLATTASDS